MEGEGGLEQPFRPSSAWAKAKKPGWQEKKNAVENGPPLSLSGSKRVVDAVEGREDSVVSRSECFHIHPDKSLTAGSSRASKKSRK
jgi:hypothetical protein